MENNIIKKSTSIQFDKNKCIGCTKCVKRCEKLCTNHLSLNGVGKNAEMIFSDTNKCVLCGKCTLVCPMKAMTEQENIAEVKDILSNKNGKTVIVQCAPSVRTSINEGFNAEHSPTNEKKLNTAFRMLGFDKIFDVNFGADITTIIEAEELIDRIKNNGVLPMFTSCCPSWVEYIKLNHKELIPNLTTAFSPQIHAGIAYKTWWAEKNNINPQDIVVVAIMPCTSKKHEINIEETKINGLKAVDYVLTVREITKMIKETKINFAELEESNGDELSEYTGASVIYCSSGVVMESALRTSYEMIAKTKLEKIEFTEVRGDFSGLKEANIDINGLIIKVAIVSGAINYMQLINSGKYKEYHYIEVMNCLGGCINGGGQPTFPMTMKPEGEEVLIAKRRSVLYSIDSGKEKRNALLNPEVKKYMEWANNQQDHHKFFHIKEHK